jgi:hypothetical protein
VLPPKVLPPKAVAKTTPAAIPGLRVTANAY